MSARIAAANGTCPCRRCQAAAFRPTFRTHKAWLDYQIASKDAAAAGRLVGKLAPPPLLIGGPAHRPAMRPPSAARGRAPQRPRLDLAAA